jgi:hypothetical protein
MTATDVTGRAERVGTAICWQPCFFRNVGAGLAPALFADLPAPHPGGDKPRPYIRLGNPGTNGAPRGLRH